MDPAANGISLVFGGIHRDHRGFVQFVNDFRPSAADRFYVLHPANVGEVRGWVGHRIEAKWFFAVAGRFDIGVVAPDNWPVPSRDLTVARYLLDANKPAVLSVPAGHFTAIVARAPGSALGIFSTGKIESAKDDDYRLPAEYWDVLSASRLTCESRIGSAAAAPGTTMAAGGNPRRPWRNA